MKKKRCERLTSHLALNWQLHMHQYKRMKKTLHSNLIFIYCVNSIFLQELSVQITEWMTKYKLFPKKGFQLSTNDTFSNHFGRAKE